MQPETLDVFSTVFQFQAVVVTPFLLPRTTVMPTVHKHYIIFDIMT